jgi:hypothetical protein
MALSVSGGESFSLSAAQKNERNILARLQRSHATEQLYQDLWHDRETIEAVTAHHLGQINPSACTVQEMDTWLTGQFNICIIIHVRDSDGRTFRKIFRCPMPHKVGEQYSPGTVDEKIRAEVATYAWIETNCPDIPIPYLHAFGLSSNLQVRPHAWQTHIECLTHRLPIVHPPYTQSRLRSRYTQQQIRSPISALGLYRK